jgi:DNA-binding MarR family transcriptional regulator
MNEYYQLHQSGLLNDPVLKRLVGDELTQQIFVSATSTSMNIDKSELKGLVQATRAGANGICTLSNYTDCQG